MDLSDPSVKLRAAKPAEGAGPKHPDKARKVGDAPSKDEEGRKRKKGRPMAADKVDISEDAEAKGGKETRGAGRTILLRREVYDKTGRVPVDDEGSNLDELG